MNRDLVNILGYEVDSFDSAQALEYAVKTGGLVVTLNPEMISQARKNPEFSKIISSSNLTIPDGIGIELGLRILGRRVKRIAGIEFAHKLIEYCAKNSKPVALVGAKPEIIEEAVAKIKAEFPLINIVYWHDGYFAEEEKIIQDLSSTNPDLVLAALGSPKQEMFLNGLKNNLPNAILIGVGGSFDVWSGRVKRAPKIWQQLGLEWLYRTIKEPQRFKRIFPTLPMFIIEVLKERLLTK